MSSLSYKEINNQEQTPFLPNYDALHHSNSSMLTTDELYKNIFLGGYPEVIANPNIDLETFFESYISTYIQKDVTKIVNIFDQTKFRKFVETVAARTGQECIINELARDNDIDNKTVEK
jgi:predicted AAA+ superfamily ATPase